MALQLIDTSNITIARALPKAISQSQAYYLGYRRNAWHSTWSKKYLPDCVSLGLDELKSTAERKRIYGNQGNVFRIETVPMLAVRYRTKAFGIIPINEKSAQIYSALMKQWECLPVASFWQIMPGRWRNWLLVFDVTGNHIEATTFAPGLLESQSNGASYRLSWNDRDGEKFFAFLDFATKVAGRFDEHTRAETGGRKKASSKGKVGGR